MDRYTIYCHKCAEDKSLIQIGEDDFLCPDCKTVYDSESGVIDNILARDYYLQYKGAVRAGLIPDPDWAEYDRENDRRF